MLRAQLLQLGHLLICLSPLWLRISVTTGAMKRAPRKVAVVARTTRNVTIQWVEDECAKAYVIGVYSLDSGE